MTDPIPPLPPVSAPHFTQEASPTPPERHEPSLENLLLRFGLVTLDQLGAAMREQTESGTPFTDVLVRDGVLSADDLAKVIDRAPAPGPEATVEPEPEPVVEPEPVFTAAEELPVLEPEPEPEPEPEISLPEPFPISVVPEPELDPEPEPEPVAAAAPEPPPLQVVGYVVRGRLVNGEEIDIATHADAAEAQRVARDAMRACARSTASDWPILSGRYVRPDAIVSIEVAEQLG